jgi:predicted NAD/FAD-dependent oxidoreductase
MALEQFKLDGRVAIVTEAGRGVGGRLALYLSTQDCYATSAVFHVDGGIQTHNSPLVLQEL